MGDFDYDEVQAKLHPTSDEPAESEVKDIDEGFGDFDMDDVSPDEDSEPKGEESEEDEAAPPATVDRTGKAVSQQPPAGTAATPDQLANVVQNEVLRMVGPDAVIKIKGVERKISDLAPQEILLGIQKGIRADQIFNEMSGERKKLEEERALVEKGAVFVQQYMDRIQSGQGLGDQTVNPQLATLLQPNPDDTEEVQYLKQNLAANMNRMSQIENQYRTTEHQARMQGIASEVLGLKKDYPMASVDEVIAIKVARPNANTEDIMRAAHNYYASEAHINEAIASNPTFRREFEAEIIKNYLGKKQAAKKIPGEKSGASNSEKVTERAKKPISDFDTAEAAARAYIKELSRAQ